METKELKHFKQKLIEKQSALTDMVHKTEGYGREREAASQDVADMAVESYTKEFLFGRSSGDRHMLQLISQALTRIDDESFGTCMNCSDSIVPKRLEAVPWASLCIECQALEEKGLLEEV